MPFRLLLALLLLCGLAAGPVRTAEGKAAPKCTACCPPTVINCCAAPQTPPQTAPIASTPGVDLKAAATPTLLCFGNVAEAPLPDHARISLRAARQPVTPRLAVTCIRLI